MQSPIIREYRAGQPYTLGNITLIPYSQVWRLGPPGKQGGFIWNRPASLLVTSADGLEQVIPIPDITRQVIWSLLAVCIGAGLMMWLINFRRKGVKQ